MSEPQTSLRPYEAGLTARGPVPTFAFHIHGWKQAVFDLYFPECDFVFIPMYAGDAGFEREWAAKILEAESPQIFVWSLRAPSGVRAFAQKHAIPIFFIEDGFIRSVEPNASRTPPLSLAFDRRTAYFDCRVPSDLERLFSTYDFDADPQLLTRARAGIRFLLETGISKYNSAAIVDIASLYGEKSAKRVLVIGQVEDDASIEFGCLPPITNNDLVRLAARENPDAQIIYKPHPDILNRVRLSQSDPSEVAHLCLILTQPLTMATALETIDHVYTITSLAGFEALLRGIKVTAYGCPFYAGWGLTDDRQPNPRRGRALTIEALFAGAYLLYPLYFDRNTGQRISFEETVDGIRDYFTTGLGAKGLRQKIRPKWRPWGPYGILGWRHLLAPVVAPLIGKIGNSKDAENFREDPILFFRELYNPKFRFVGRLLYPFDRKRR